jgi:hypothetical protein
MREIGCLIILIAAGMAARAANVTEITVQVFNNAGAPRRVVARAERTAARIFSKAGIAVRWLDCPPYSRELGPDQVCRDSADRAFFVVSINEQCPPEEHDIALGYAVLAGRGNHAAAVYPRISAFEATESEPDADVLGAVLAHELGHLIFRSVRHGKGIMKPIWTRDDLIALGKGRLTFTGDEGRALQSMLVSSR